MNTINEHLGLINNIDLKFKMYNDTNDEIIRYNLNYIDEDEYCAIELSISSELKNINSIYFLTETISKLYKSHIISDIYTIENEKLYVIHLLSLKNIRDNKIKKLKNKLELVHQ